MAEVIKWANGQGLTLYLSQKEIEELFRLLRSFVEGYRVTGETTHFIVEQEE